MTARSRQAVFLPTALIMAGLFWWAYRDLPPVGRYRGPYGDYILAHAVAERHATDTVNAVTYDYRGIDTLGEEFILFASVTGVTLLFRRQPDARPDPRASEERRHDRDIVATEATRVTMEAIVAVMVVFGVYIVSHGQLTPGGGFQGGVILATAPLVMFVAGRLRTFDRAVSHPAVAIAEGLGAAGYAAIGAAALIGGLSFLTNWMPLGTVGSLLSSGTIAAISLAVGIEVTGSFMLLMHCYLKETIENEGVA